MTVDRASLAGPGNIGPPSTTWDATYRVRFDEAGPDGRLRTSGFMRYAQDLAWQHSTGLGFGRSWYAERGLTWLVRAAELVVLDPPEMGSNVVARTLIAGIRRVFARRHGEFRTEDGRLTGWVDTDWVLIDARGAPTRIPPVFAEHFGEGAPIASIGRVALPETPPDAARIAFVVRPHEVDPYAHVNNAVYLDWMEEAILAAADPEARRAIERSPRRYRMEFALAAEAGVALESAAWPDADGWAYRLTGDGAGPDRFRARLDADGPEMEETR
jgi:acyl-ACP thioesterase